MTKRSHTLRLLLLLLPGAGYIVLFLALTLAMTLLQSLGLFNFTGASRLGMHEWSKVANRQTWDSFAYSASIAFISAFLSLLIAYPLALYLRGRFIGKSFLTALMRVPLFVPALVAAFLILNILSYHGLVNEFLLMLGVIREPLRMTHDDWGVGVIAIQVWKNMPLQALILTSALASIPNDLEQAARNLGANAWAVFRLVLFPLSIPGALTGVILVFIGVFGDFSINTVAGPLYPPTLSMRMFLLSKSFGEWGQGASIAVIIIVGSLVFAWLYTRLARLITRGYMI
jgi:putative spermidine/putrescine transport system permease protein